MISPDLTLNFKIKRHCSSLLGKVALFGNAELVACFIDSFVLPNFSKNLIQTEKGSSTACWKVWIVCFDSAHALLGGNMDKLSFQQNLCQTWWKSGIH